MPVVGPVAVRVQAVGTAVPPLSLVTVLTSVNVAGWSSLSMVQVALTPGVRTRLAPVRVPASQSQSPAVYPAGPPDSESSVGAGVDRDGRDRGGPGGTRDAVVGPVAVRVQSVGRAVPPSSLVTVLTNVNVAGWSLLMMVHVTLAPGTTRTT